MQNHIYTQLYQIIRLDQFKNFMNLNIYFFSLFNKKSLCLLNFFTIYRYIACFVLTTPLKVTLWHHLYSNIINTTQQSIDCCIMCRILLDKKYCWIRTSKLLTVFFQIFFPRGSLLFVHVYKWLARNGGMMLF